MSTPIEIPYNQHTTNGVLTSFTYQFLVTVSTEMKVYFKEDGEDQIEVNPSNYTVNGVGTQGGSTVDFFSAPANGVLTLLRVTDLDQDYTIPPTGALDRAGLEGALDKIMRQQQETQAVLDNQVIKTEETDSGPSTVSAQDLIDAAASAETSAAAAKVSEDNAATSAGIATGVAATIEADADAAVAAATAAQVPPAVTAEVDAQVGPKVDDAVAATVPIVVPEVAEDVAETTTEQYLDANLNGLVDTRVEQVAVDQVQDAVADEVPPAVQTEVERVLDEEVIDITQGEVNDLVDDAIKGRQRDNQYEVSEIGGFIATMSIRNTVTVPHRHRFMILADTIASGAEVILENGSEAVYDPENLVFTPVSVGQQAPIQKVDLSDFHPDRDNANTTTTFNGTNQIEIDTVDNIGWIEGDTLRFINVGATTININTLTGVTLIPTGTYTLAPENQILLELVDVTSNTWYVTQP